MNEDQLTGNNMLDPVKIEASRYKKFCDNHVCSVCRSHPQAKPSGNRNEYGIYCLVCEVPIIEGGYISVHDLRKLEDAEYDTGIKVRKVNREFNEQQALKELGF